MNPLFKLGCGALGGAIVSVGYYALGLWLIYHFDRPNGQLYNVVFGSWPLAENEIFKAFYGVMSISVGFSGGIGIASILVVPKQNRKLLCRLFGTGGLTFFGVMLLNASFVNSISASGVSRPVPFDPFMVCFALTPFVCSLVLLLAPMFWIRVSKSANP